MVLTRENIRDGFVQRMVRESDSSVRVLSEEELQASRRAVLAAWDGESDVWVFGYGSLIWNPAFHFTERRIGRLYGYHRRFCLWTHLGRGTRENPGLLLGLERGGSCTGIALRVAASAVEEELSIIWRREMVTGSYAPRAVTVHLSDGRVPAVAFVINHAHDRYARFVPEDQVAEVIARARGPLGPCIDYLVNTVAHLEELGIHDRPLERLRDRVTVLTEGATTA